MVRLSLSLLGPFQVWTANGALQPFRTLKERALLSYLAVEHSKTHTREALAELFWPERAENVSRNNLRQALFGIRQAIGEQVFEAVFNVTPVEIQFNLCNWVWLDLAAFDAHFKAYRLHVHAEDRPCSFCLQHLSSAVEVYRGDFLQDISLDKNQDFQEWLVFSRERYLRQQEQILEYLITSYEQMGQYEQAAQFALRLVQLDDLKENLYHRLMVLLARTGQYSAALEQFEICKYKLNDVLGIEPDQELVHLAEQIRSGRFLEQLSPASPTFHNLPEQLTPFIGREMELARIGSLFEQPAARILTLTGPGGVGKTRLAIQSAMCNLRLFPEGVFFVPLETVHSADQFIEAIGHAIGLAPTGQQDFHQTLLENLRSRSLLLILDNFEQLLEARPLLLDMLRAAPTVKILVTSRERLHFQAEQVIDLGGLAFPELDFEEDVSALANLPEVAVEGSQSRKYEALHLFLDRAQRVRQDYGSPDGASGSVENFYRHRAGDLKSVARICRAVDGLPLAIELAASWARDYSFAQIAEEVQHSLDFFQASFYDLPERHRSIRASFEHSWDLLSENEREALCKLSVFPGSFSLSAAQAVAGAALPWIIALEDKSLVRHTGFGRYRLHALIRQFALQKLRQYSRKIEEQLREKHADHFCAFLQEREMDFKGKRQAEALKEVEPEMENIRAAWDWAVENRAAHLLGASGFSLLFFLEIRGRWRAGQNYFARAVQSLQNQPLDAFGKRVLAYLMTFYGWFCCRLTYYDQARESLYKSLDLMGKSEASNVRAFAHFGLGFWGLWTHHFEEAHNNLSTSLAISRQAGDQWGHAWALELLTEIAFESGRSGCNEAPFLETLALFDSFGEKRGSSRALNYLGNIAITQGRYPEARSYFEKMVANLEKIGDVWGAGSGYSKLGQVTAATGDTLRAWDLYQRGLKILQKTGDQRRIAFVLGEMGELAVVLEKRQEAEHYFHQALETAAWSHTVPLAQDLLIRAAAVLYQAGQPERAADLITAALSCPVGDQLTLNMARRLLQRMDAEYLLGSPAGLEEPISEMLIWEKVNDLLRDGIIFKQAVFSKLIFPKV